MMLLALLSIVPVETVARDKADVIERNSFYDEQGRVVFVQHVFYDWCPHCERFQVRAWRLEREHKPERDWERGGYMLLWNDGETTREVRADSLRETWLQYDPELEERAVLDKSRRRELTPAARPR